MGRPPAKMDARATYARAYLQQIQTFDRKIEMGVSEIHLLREVVEKTGAKFDDEIKEAQIALGRDINSRALIIQQLRAVKDWKAVQILTLRYVDGLMWKEIADRMHYSTGYAWMMHRDALHKFMDVLDNLPG